MIEEMNEVIRVLQLTTYDEDEWDSDNLTVMKKTQNIIEGSLQNGHDWLKVGFNLGFLTIIFASIYFLTLHFCLSF